MLLRTETQLMVISKVLNGVIAPLLSYQSFPGQVL